MTTYPYVLPVVLLCALLVYGWLEDRWQDKEVDK